MGGARVVDGVEEEDMVYKDFVNSLIHALGCLLVPSLSTRL